LQVNQEALACLVFGILDKMHLIGNVRSFLDQAQELVKAANDEYAAHKIVEFHRSRLFRKGAASGRRIGEHMSINMHTMGTSFVEKVKRRAVNF